MNQTLVDRVYRRPGRATRAIVDLDAIAQNLVAARKIVEPMASVMAVVKANGYGHGAVAVARTAVEAGADALAVATVDEGLRLRRAEITVPILVLGPIDQSEIPLAIDSRLELSVGSLATADSIATIASNCRVPTPVPVHLKIDTGMHRFGVEAAEAVAVAEFIRDRPSLKLRGVFTHFARADEGDAQPTARQEALFSATIEKLAGKGITPEVIHSANSAATLRSIGDRHNLVRFGIGLYGLSPSIEVPITPIMRPAMTIISRIARVHTLAPGDAVSYGATYRATESERVALAPIGYADGYRRANSNRGTMLVGGACCPVRGRVCMDQTVIALPRDSKAVPGDLVIVGGAWDEPGAASFDQLAAWAGTINYEIATGISARVPKFYVRAGEVVAVEDLEGFRAVETTTK